MEFYYMRSNDAFEAWWEMTFNTNPQGWIGANDPTGSGNNYQYNGLGIPVPIPPIIMKQKICASPLNGSCLQYSSQFVEPSGPCMERSNCAPNTTWNTCQILSDPDPAIPQSDIFF